MAVKEQILGCVDLRRKTVEVPQWKQTLTIQELSLQQSLAAFGPDRLADDGKIKLAAVDIAQVVAWSVIDSETGERIFSDEDAPALAGKGRAPLMLLYNEIISLSGTAEDAEKN